MCSAWIESISTDTYRTCRWAGKVVTFMTKHLGYRIPSPAIMEKIGTQLRQDVSSFAEDHHIPGRPVQKADRSCRQDRDDMQNSTCGDHSVHLGRDFGRLRPG